MVVEEFATILRKERSSDLISFLRSLDKQGKKELAAGLKPLQKEYLEYRQVSSLIGHSSFKQKASPAQVNILHAAAFVCCNRKEYQKIDGFSHFLNNPLVPDILSWYCPDWFSDVINDLTKQNWLPWNFRYNTAMEFVDKGYLQPTDELLARLIPQIIFELDKDHKQRFVRENVERWPITLSHHIWLIFQFETDIHLSDRYSHFGDSKKDVKHWLETLKHYTALGVIDRERLLQESLLATGRNFNKTLSGWFVELFEFLEPTVQELISLQSQLIITLSSQHSKAVNAALNGMKVIVESPEFNVSGLLENTPVLLSSETKSVVTATLTLLEKLLRKHPDQREAITVSVCHAFIHNDENIQNKAAKLLLKYHDASRQSVNDELGRYADSMLMSAKKTLAAFLIEAAPIPDDIVPGAATQPAEAVALPALSSLDELVFLASQAFDNNDPLHIDLLPAALVNLQDQVTGAELHKFEPALQRAYATVMNDWTSTMGYLDHLLATFFIDVTRLWIEWFPAEGASLQKIHDAFKKKDEENKAKWSWYKSRILALLPWRVESGDTIYLIHKAILVVAYEKLKKGRRQPILSTPTHACGYVDPLIVVQRLLQYRAADVLPDGHDFQIAIARIASFHRDEALTEARRVLTGETLNLLEFLLNDAARPIPPFHTPYLWFMAGIAKSPRQHYPEFKDFSYAQLPSSVYTGEVPWRSFVENYKVKKYDYGKKRYEDEPAERNVLRLTLDPVQSPGVTVTAEDKGFFSKLTRLVTPGKKDPPEETRILYQFISFKAKYLSAEHNDVQRFIYLMPSNPNPILTLVTARALEYSKFWSETDKKMVTKTLEALVDLTLVYNEVTYLFIATCMVSSDKTVRSFAAELWIKGVAARDLDSTQIGRIIGMHLSGEYAPMKRFTDLISENLLKVSGAHNKALELLFTTMIEYLPDEPPVGTKRYLDLYAELLALNKSTLTSEPAGKRLKAWSSSASLKKLISSLV
ncbi:DUF6493 family protein [Dawidia soli]|uniref:Uncharacterized protein n=1 Tax=Dawidia soli TaxID=2782352 RepID=A0AAP2DEH7_9BACT|nr:DUF6493 family protein [Dawidia soli]MBT1689295.1 hypothetical protein [Dawidia soli]